MVIEKLETSMHQLLHRQQVWNGNRKVELSMVPSQSPCHQRLSYSRYLIKYPFCKRTHHLPRNPLSICTSSMRVLYNSWREPLRANRNQHLSPNWKFMHSFMYICNIIVTIMAKHNLLDFLMKLIQEICKLSYLCVRPISYETKITSIDIIGLSLATISHRYTLS